MSTSLKSKYSSLLSIADLPSHPPRPSAAIVPWRRSPGGALEVYWVQRAEALRFMGGFHAFPGGGLSRSDGPIPVAGQPPGLAKDSASPAAAKKDSNLPPDHVPGLLAGALRELFEETGLLWADGLPAREALCRARRHLLAEERPFADLLADLAVELDGSRLVFAGRWLTPPFVPRRFDNRFFLLHWPKEERMQPEVLPGELASGEWIEPTQALERWRRGEILTAPPILHILRVLDEDGPEEGLHRLRDPQETYLGPLRRVEFLPGIILLPLKTPTLLPATHTNAFILGHRQAVLVDPATPIEAEQDRLIHALRAAQEQGFELTAIWLTHHHPDHIGAVERVRREFDLPVLAHPDSAAPLAAQGIRLDGELIHGQRVELEGDPAMTLRVIHTPGHARGHLSFFEEHTRALIAGDLLSSLSTIVIAPPDGDMDTYLTSLERAAALEPSALFPSHGALIRNSVAKLHEIRDHRLEREAAVLAAYRTGMTTPEAMVAEVYHDVPAAIHPVACWQIAAHLERLRKIGKIS